MAQIEVSIPQSFPVRQGFPLADRNSGSLPHYTNDFPSDYLWEVNCPSNKPTNILLIEDTEDDAFFFSHALRMTGLATHLTRLCDGGEALEYFTALKEGTAESVGPDLVFLDLKLPKYSGFEILRWITEQRFDPPLRITILSGSDHPADLTTARELGVSDYVVKPIPSDELKRRILALQSLEIQPVGAGSETGARQ